MFIPQHISMQPCGPLPSACPALGLTGNHWRPRPQVYRAAQVAGALEAAEYARAIVPVDLIRAVLPHLTEPRREQLRATLSVLMN